MLGMTGLSYGQEHNLRVIVKEMNVLNLESQDYREVAFQLVGKMSAEVRHSIDSWNHLKMLNELSIKEEMTDVFTGYFRVQIPFKLMDVLEIFADSGVTEIERKGEVMTIAKAQQHARELDEDE